MRYCLRLSCFLLACFPAAALAESKETLLEETARVLKETTAALAAVKDAEGAKAVRPKLDRLTAQMKKVMKEVPSLSKPNPDENDKRIIRIWSGMQKASMALHKELLRLDVNPKTHKVLRDQKMMVSLRKAMEARAHIGAEGLSVQLEVFKLNNGKYPGKIEELAKAQGKQGAMVPPDKLRDPWGQLYQLDPAGKHNKGNKCDVWSPGHPLEKKAIGNWVNRPEPKKKTDKARPNPKDG